MRLWMMLSLACGALGIHDPAMACSCAMQGGTHQQQVQHALNSADAVLVVKVRAVAQAIDREVPDWPVITEDVQFVVIEVLKGEFLRGQPVVTRSLVSRGACGIPARNEPGWIMDVRRGLDVPVRFSDTWLVFLYGNEPFELSMCPRSGPLNLLNAQQDLALVRQLLDKVPPMPPRWESAAFALR